jgi:hypothetical protein
MIPEPGDRTVKIPAEWRGGKWQLFGGGELPKLKDGAIVDLVFPAIYLAEPEDVERWTEEITLRFLPKGTELFVRITLKNVPPAMLQKTFEKDFQSGVPCRFVLIVLDEDLGITLVPGKKGLLTYCRCLIPALGETAESVNEAYKKIATQFEPTRRSTSGNIFLYAFIEQNGRLVKLDTLRDQLPGRQLELHEKLAKQEALTRKVEGSNHSNLFGSDN